MPSGTVAIDPSLTPYAVLRVPGSSPVQPVGVVILFETDAGGLCRPSDVIEDMWLVTS